MRVLLFTSEHCAPCRIAKQIVDEHYPEVELLDISHMSNDKAAKLGNTYMVRQVPTLVVVDDDNDTAYVYGGVDQIKKSVN